MKSKVSEQIQLVERDRSEIRFSIVITCHNQQNFIKDAVESVLSQEYPYKEVIVVDDGSRDGSLAVLKSYGNAIRLLALRVNVGAVEARNRGAALAGGEYLIFLDGDDLFTPWTLDVYEQFVNERHPALIVSRVRHFQGPVPQFRSHEAPERVEYVEYEALMAKDRTHPLYTSALAIKRRVFYEADGWSPGIFQMDDMDLAAKLGFSGSSIIIDSPFTILYRMHAGNTVHIVGPFLRSARLMMNKEHAGRYPGDSTVQRFQRYAFHGGMIFYWTKRGLRAGLYWPALHLAAGNWSMIVAALVRKSMILLKGQRPVEVRKLRSTHGRPSSVYPPDREAIVAS